MYVRICLCIYTCMYVYTYVCMYQRKKVCDVCTCVYMHGSLYTLLIYVCTYIYTLYLPLANSQEQPPSKLIKKQKQPPENTGLLAKAKNYVREGSSGSGYFTTTPTPVPSNSLTPSPPPLFYNSKVFTTTPFFYNNAHAGAMPSNALNPYLSPLALTPHPPQFQSFNPHPECGYLATLTHLIIPSTLTLFANGHGTLFC